MTNPLPAHKLSLRYSMKDSSSLRSAPSRLSSGTHWASAVIKRSFWIQSFSFHTVLPSQPELRFRSYSLLQRTCHLGLRLHHFLCFMALLMSHHQFPRPQAVAQVSHFSTSPSLYAPRRNEAEQV